MCPESSKNRRRESAAAAFLLVLIAAGCGREPDRPPAETDAEPDERAGVAAASPAPAEEPEAAIGATADGAPAAGAGTGMAEGAIAGRVIYTGELPETTKVYIPEAGRLEAHTIITDPRTRGLKNAAVWIDGRVRSSRAKARPAPAVIDQDNWTFVPHVLAVRVGQEVRFKNSDVANHNVHSMTSGQEFNIGTPAGEWLAQRFVKPTGARPVRLGCDLHDWMRAWIYVFPHHAFSVTDAAGRFRIDGMPPGKWTLRVHHADGSLERAVEVLVEAGKTAEIEVELPGGPPAGEE